MYWFDDVLTKQVKLQKRIKHTKYSADLVNVKDMYGAATGMMVEIGEMLQCDTRWKKEMTMSNKTPVYEHYKFIEECADVFIYLMNVLIYAGITRDEFKNAVLEKQDVVKERFNDDI